LQRRRRDRTGAGADSGSDRARLLADAQRIPQARIRDKRRGDGLRFHPRRLSALGVLSRHGVSMATTTTQGQAFQARERIAAAGGAALLAAGLIVVMFVLPAEYAVDPLGTGAKLGLLDLGITGKQIDAVAAQSARGAGQAPVIVPQERVFNEETVEFKVAPH